MSELSLPQYKKKEIEEILAEVELLLKEVRKELEKFAKKNQNKSY